MRTERKQGLTKREFLATSLAAVGGLLLSSDSSFAFKASEKQADASAFSDRYASFWERWKGLVFSIGAGVGIKELHSRIRKPNLFRESFKGSEPLVAIVNLAVERRAESLGVQLGDFRVDGKLIRKQLRSLQRSYKSRALRVLNNPKIIPWGREGEWIFLIDSGLYCYQEAELALKKGDFKRASLLLAIADEDRIILNKESWKYQNQISFEGLKEIDKEQRTFKYGRERRRKTCLEVVEDKRSAILFHNQLTRYLRRMMAQEEPLSDQILDRIFRTEVSIASAVHKFLVLPKGLIYESYEDGREHSQAEGLLEEIEKKLKDILLAQVNYQKLSKREKLLAYWSLARSIEKFKDFEGKVLEQTDVSNEKVNLVASVV